jgi:hypothetical protein
LKNSKIIKKNNKFQNLKNQKNRTNNTQKIVAVFKQTGFFAQLF